MQQAEETRAPIREAFADGFMRDAVAVASPSLEAATGTGGARVDRALLRYLIRAGTRPTPFGLFATVDAVPAGGAPQPLRLGDDELRAGVFAAAGASRREAGRQAAAAPGEARWVVSPALYRAGGSVRVLVADHARGRTLTQSLGETAALATVLRLAAEPRSGDALIEALAAEDPAAPRSEAAAFVARLARSGVIVPHTARQAARFAGEDDPCEEIVVRAALEGGGGGSAALRRPDRHVVARRPGVQGAAGAEVVETALHAARVLRALVGDPPDPLAGFRRSFGERFEGRPVGLLEALDPELGLEVNGVPAEPGGTLLQAQPHGSAPGEPELPAATVALQLRLLERAWSTGRFHQELAEADLAALPVPAAPWPATMAAVLRLSAREPAVAVDTVAGPSAARMFGRFGRGDPRVDAVITAVAAAERDHAPAALHAEVSFLPPSRAADTVVRNCPYPHRIVLDGRCVSAQDIPVRDVQLLLRRGRLLAVHGPTGREIVPHVTHTARHEETVWPPAHRILALLEPAGAFESLRWRWGALGTAARLPRVSSGGAILCRERWNLRLGAVDDGQVVEALREAGVPGDVELEVEGEPPLALRLRHRVCRDLLRERLLRDGAARLVERWPAAGDSAVRSSAGAHAHELIVETFAPLVAALRDRGELVRWHFVRIRDRGFHLRLRLAAASPQGVEPLRAAARDALAPPAASGRVLRVSEVEYVPEVHRYGGGRSMTLAEQLFELDSDRVVEVLRLIGPLRDDDEALVHAGALDCVSKLRGLAGGDAQSALAACERLVDAFGRADPGAVDVDALWRRHRSLDGPWDAIHALQAAHEADLRRHAGRRPARDADVIVSHVHMASNRLFRFQQPAHEALAYELARRRLNRPAPAAGR